jgi:DNA polymerase elongation subunit (family B)
MLAFSRTQLDFRNPHTGNLQWDITGRVHYDVIRSVRGDQKLYGLKDFKLKTVGAHFGIEELKELSMVAEGKGTLANTDPLINTDELRTYVTGDTVGTNKLAAIYLRNIITMAEFLRVPFNNMVETYNSFPAKIFHARHLKQLNIFPSRSNIEKYTEMFELDDSESMRFEAAIVKINGNCPKCGKRVINHKCNCGERFINDDELDAPGFIPSVEKCDFASMYPTCIMTFNLSPETTRIEKLLPYENTYKFARGPNTLWLQIPDRNYNRSIVIRIDMSKRGFLPGELIKMREERIKIKEEKKTADKEQQDALDSQQYAIKVIMNIAYGYNGLNYCRYGDLAVAIATVGMCRWMTMNVENWLGDCVVEIDTDGYYLDRWEEGREHKLNNALSKLIKRVAGVDSYMALEHEHCGSGYFYKAKNYVLWNGKEMTYHGTSFKSSRLSSIYERALHKLAKAIVSDERDIWSVIEDCLDFSKLNVSDFVMRFRLSKELKEYANPNCLQVRLSNRMNELIGYSPMVGDQVEYLVVAGHEYKLLPEVDSVSEIDIDYYRDDVDKVLALFNLKRPLEITDGDLDEMGVELEEEEQCDLV